jgi:hypothetical protein
MPPPEPRFQHRLALVQLGHRRRLPQPRLASTAVSGSWSRSVAAYSAAPIPGCSSSREVEGGGQAAEGVPPQGVVGPGAALPARQQPGLEQLLEMVADARLAEPERPR